LVVPNVPAHGDIGANRFGKLVDVRIGALLAVIPQLFPSEYFRVFHQQPPEGDEGAIRRTIRRPAVADKRSESGVAFDGSLYLDAAGLCLTLAEITEAGDFKGIRSSAAMRRAASMSERALALASPQNPVNGRISQVIFRKILPKFPR